MTGTPFWESGPFRREDTPQTRCECIMGIWDSQDCPFKLDCNWAMGYYSYTQLFRDDTGTITGYMHVCKRVDVDEW